MWQRDLGGAVLAALAMIACGGAAAPTQKLTNTQAAIRGAQEVGAEQNPKAALHLKMARDQVARIQEPKTSDGPPPPVVEREVVEAAVEEAEPVPPEPDTPETAPAGVDDGSGDDDVGALFASLRGSDAPDDIVVAEEPAPATEEPAPVTEETKTVAETTPVDEKQVNVAAVEQTCTKFIAETGTTVTVECAKQ